MVAPRRSSPVVSRLAACALAASLEACTSADTASAPDAAARVDRPAAPDASVDALRPPLDVQPVDRPRPDVSVDVAPDRAPDVADVGVDASVRCAAGMDSDGDGLANDVECGLGTDPFAADSDMDGLADGAEANYPRACVATDRAAQRRPPTRCTADSACAAGERCVGLDPRRADSDGDTVPDGAEDASGRGVVEVARGETDPRLWDTDGDGRSDAEAGIAICRPSGLATVVQTALPMAPTQVGFDPAWTSARRVTGTASRAGVLLDAPASLASALVAALPATGDVRAESARLEAAVLAALGAGAAPVLVGRALTTHEGNPAVTSTFRVARNVAVTALRDALVMPLLGVAAPAGTTAFGASAEALVDVTTVRRTMGRSAGTTDLVVTVAPRAASEDRTLPTGIRTTDLVNATALAESDRGLGFHCQTLRAPAPPTADFVWTVDVSPSMGPYQVASGDTATRFFADLGRAGIDFRVAVLQAQSNAFNFTRPGLRWVSSSSPTGASELAWRATVERYMNNPMDALAPYPNNGSYTLQLNEEPIAAAVLAFSQLLDGAAMGAAPDLRVRSGAQLVSFFVADETGTNDDTRYFARDTARWGATYPARLRAAIEFFRMRRILTFGMVNDQASDCAAGVVADFRRCLILGNGGAYIPIRGGAVDPGVVTAAMIRIVSAVVGASSPYRLERQPITSTLKVRVRGVDVPRSRDEGFDYDPAAGSVVFHGTRYRPAMGDEVAISFRVWQPCPASGGACRAAGECCAPEECILGRCQRPCARAGAACATSADCCAPTTCVMGRCETPATCRPVGGACRADMDCCPPNRCTAGACAAPPPCATTGMTCSVNADCCSGTCTAGRCAPPPCRPVSGMCTSPADCCSGSCSAGLCAPG